MRDVYADRRFGSENMDFRSRWGLPMTDERRNDLLVRLLDALETYYQNLSPVDDEGRRAFREVTAWFASTDKDDENGFERLCAALDFDADRIRQSLARRSSEIRGVKDVPPKR